MSGLIRRNVKVQNFGVNGTVTGGIGSTPLWGTGKAWYVDKNQASGVKGDGTTWEKAFLTITDGIAALSDYDVLYIAPAYYNEALTLVLSGLEGVKIFGTGTGMQWNEGGVCIGDEISDDDLLEIDNCKGLELAGLMFYNTEDEKDAINFVTENSYAVHIHDCSFIGDTGGGTIMEDAIGGANSCSDMIIERCRFFRQENTAINKTDVRNVIRNNLFIIAAGAIGIACEDADGGYTVIVENYFLGATTGDYGIKLAKATAGNFIFANNKFVNFDANKSINQMANAEANTVRNYVSDEGSGAGVSALIDPTS